MNYEQKYKKALEKAQEAVDKGMVTQNFVSDIFPELKEESEDEKIRKEIIDFLELPHPQFVGKRDHEKWITWIEKQGEHKKFRNSIQVGDMVTRNRDGVLVNLSQLNRVANELNRILSFINTLEVKKVDLEKEIKEVQRNYKTIDEYEGYPAHIYSSDIELIAIHFFKLGLKAQKGE